MNKELNYNLTDGDKIDHLKAGIILIVVALIMAAFPTILAMRHILDIASANVRFGLATWYIFALCAVIAGCGFIRHSMTCSAARQNQTA